MTMLKTKTVAPVAASIAAAVLMASSVTASAQSAVPPDQPGIHSRVIRRPVRPLTVRARPVVVARPVVAAPAPVVNPIAGLGTVVAAPLVGIGGALTGAGGPRKGGVTAVRYVGAGAEEAKIDEGWVQPVPVDKSGPIFVVENGDPTISPLTFIGAPIAAAGAVVQLPFRILGGAPVVGTY